MQHSLLERVQEPLGPLLSQVIRFADPDRVNTFLIITHVDHFTSRSGAPNYIHFDEETEDSSYSAEYEGHIQHWDQTLAELIDPLVEEGYLQWISLPEMGRLYLEWEKACGLR